MRVVMPGSVLIRISRAASSREFAVIRPGWISGVWVRVSMGGIWVVWVWTRVRAIRFVGSMTVSRASLPIRNITVMDGDPRLESGLGAVLRSIMF